MIDLDSIRCEASDAARDAQSRGGVSGLIDLVIALTVERARLTERVRRLEIQAGLTRDTEPCGAPEEGGPG